MYTYQIISRDNITSGDKFQIQIAKLKCDFLESNEVFKQIIEKCNLSIAKYKTSKINGNKKYQRNNIFGAFFAVQTENVLLKTELFFVERNVNEGALITSKSLIIKQQIHQTNLLPVFGINPFPTSVPPLYAQKSDNRRFSDVFRGIEVEYWLKMG